MILNLPPPQIILKVVESDQLVIEIQTCPAFNVKRRENGFFPHWIDMNIYVDQEIFTKKTHQCKFERLTNRVPDWTEKP